MRVDVLQRFLTARMFDVAGEDTRVTRLRETASDLADALKAAPERIATFTMVAIDAQAGVDEPIVAEVMKLLEHRWQSYAGAFSDERLPTVARAIVLQALAGSMNADSVAACVAATARNMLPRIGPQVDRALWADLLTAADARLDARAHQEWALPRVAAVEELALRLDAGPGIEAPEAPSKWLTSRMAAAAGPGVASGETPQAPMNQHWPQNGGPNWSYEFAPIAAAAIAQAIDDVVGELVAAINDRHAAQATAAAITSYVAAANQVVARTAAVLDRRTALLWWKEALYSHTAKVGYRGLEPAVAAALVAIDASAQTGAFAPGMAESLVRETARAVDPEAMTCAVPLVDLCIAITSGPDASRAVIREALSHVHVEYGRAPLAGLLGQGEELTGAMLRARLGLDEALSISPVELCLWLFRDLQAAAATPPSVKRKRGQRGA